VLCQELDYLRGPMSQEIDEEEVGLVRRGKSKSGLLCDSPLVMLWTTSLADWLRHIPGFEV
jgi:hypothetical protein